MSEAAAGGRKNFLAHMVERASESTNVVRPRVPGLFEPVSALGVGHVDRGDEGAESAHAARWARRGLSNFDDVAANTPSDAVLVRVAAFANRAGAPMQPIEHAAAALSPNPMRENSASAIPTDTQSSLTHDARLSAVTTVQGSLLAKDGGDLMAARSSFDRAMRNAEVPRQSARDESLPTRARSGATASLDDDNLPKNALTPKRVRVESAPDAREGTRGSKHTDSADTAPEPSIHISIGRVEVRAVTQPPKQARRTDRRPMSLDAYLSRKERAR